MVKLKRMAAVLIAVIAAFAAIVPALASVDVPCDNCVRFIMNSVEADPGDEIAVTLSLEGGVPANALTLFVYWDADLLERTGTPQHGALWDSIEALDGMVETNGMYQGRFGFIGIVPEEAPACEGELFTLTFRVSGNASQGSVIPITIEVRQLSYDSVDGTVTAIPYETTDGSVTIKVHYLKGDVNNDGVVDSVDALMALRCALGIIDLDGPAFEAADVNGDGMIRSDDALMILRYALGIISSL